LTMVQFSGVTPQRAKIKELETTISKQKKEILDLKWQIYHLKHEPGPNETTNTKLEHPESTKLKAIIEGQKVEITRLEELCRNAGIDPNSEGNQKEIAKLKKLYQEAKGKVQTDATLKGENANQQIKYSILRKWHPYEKQTGLGLDIWLETDLSEAQIVSFLMQLTKDKDPVKINIYTDRTVYENEKKGIYGPEYGKHFLLVYIKNTTVKRAFYGVDEIRWMQESGKFSHLFGKKTPMPTIERENVALPKHTIGENRAIDISYDQVMEYLSNFFLMEKSTPVDGQDRYMGQTFDNLAVLEIIGKKNNISQATLMIGIPNDAADKLVRNTILAMRFLENTVPEWTDSNEWITANAKRVADIPGVSDVEVFKGNKLITMTFLKPLGMLTLTVKHK